MTFEELVADLRQRFADASISAPECGSGDAWIEVAGEWIPDILSYLKTAYHLDYLACLTGIDYGNRLGVVYNLRSLGGKYDITIKTIVSLEDPVVPTVSHLYGVAGWFEREAFDLLGIKFKGHADLRRILLPDDWEGHPLRKDYEPPQDYHGIPCSRPNPLDLLTPESISTKTTDKFKRVRPDNTGSTPPRKSQGADR